MMLKIKNQNILKKLQVVIGTFVCMKRFFFTYFVEIKTSVLKV